MTGWFEKGGWTGVVSVGGRGVEYWAIGRVGGGRLRSGPHMSVCAPGVSR